MSLLFESIIVGMITIIIGYVAGGLAYAFAPIPSIPYECKKWNANHTMEWSLFFTGMLLYLTLGGLGYKKLYCGEVFESDSF